MKIEKKVHTNKLAQKIASKTKEREIHNEKEIKVPQIKKIYRTKYFFIYDINPLIYKF